MLDSRLLLPTKPLANCIMAGIYRDTRRAGLSDEDRLNYFPASPTYTLSIVFSGALQSDIGVRTTDELRERPCLPRVSVMPPQNAPITSWSSGDITALSIAFFPEAWAALGGEIGADEAPQALPSLIGNLDETLAIDDYWAALCRALSPVWAAARHNAPASNWTGSDSISDWSRHMLLTAALSGPGRSLRAAERRFRRWTGQTRQSAQFFARMENLHALATALPNLPASEVAAEAKFSDQSHMGRAVKRATGFSPAKLNAMIATQEPFWCYRLLGERF